MDLKIVISSINTNTTQAGISNLTNYRTFVMFNQFLIVLEPFPFSYSYFLTYVIDNSTNCLSLCGSNCTFCPNTYTFDSVSGKCIKNYTVLGTNNQIVD
jgi:hypothetical protein